VVLVLVTKTTCMKKWEVTVSWMITVSCVWWGKQVYQQMGGGCSNLVGLGFAYAACLRIRLSTVTGPSLFNVTLAFLCDVSK
jgi:hypothetical protein